MSPPGILLYKQTRRVLTGDSPPVFRLSILS
jgi:hypothetical protein